MNIGFLLLIDHTGYGGVEHVLNSITHQLKKSGHNSYLYGMKPPTTKFFLNDLDKYLFLRYPKWMLKKQSSIPKFIYRLIDKSIRRKHLKKILKRAKTDQLDTLIVLNLHKQFSQNYSIIKKFITQNDIPLISWPHGTLSTTNSYYQNRIKKQINIFSAHFAISYGIAEEIISYYGNQNIYIIQNPVNRANIISRKFNKFLYIGRIDDNKRVHSLLKNLKNLKGNWTLDIYGSTGNESADIAFQTFIQSLNLKNHVIFHGWQPNVWNQIDSAGVLLLNSLQEGFPLVIAEAMMRGIPVLSSNCPTGPSELIDHGKNGWLYPIDDEQKGIKILQKILNKNIKLPDQKLIQESVTHLAPEFVTERFINGICSIISSSHENTTNPAQEFK